MDYFYPAAPAASLYAPVVPVSASPAVLHFRVTAAIDELGLLYETAIGQVSDQVHRALGLGLSIDPTPEVRQAIEAARVHLTQAHLTAVGRVLEAAGGDLARSIQGAGY